MRYEKFENVVVIAIAAAFAVVQIYFALAATRGAMHVRAEHSATVAMTQNTSVAHSVSKHSKS